MAGICTGLGLGTDADGLLTIEGARVASWPNEPVCPSSGNSGLKVDPNTGKAWVAPDPDFASYLAVGEDITIVPQTTNTRQLSEVEWKHRSRKCTRSLFAGMVGGGYAGFRVGSGNFWQVKRHISIFLDGVPAGYTGVQEVAACENNSGGVLAQGHVVASDPMHIQIPPDTELRIVAHYELDPATYSAHVLNGFTWRSPVISGAFLSYP